MTEKKIFNGVSVANLSTEKQLIKIQGITTSPVQQALKASKTNGLFPYPARIFLKVEGEKKDIPIFFRIKDENNQWIRPKISKGSYLELTGYFTDPIKSNQRLSFTAVNFHNFNNYSSCQSATGQLLTQQDYGN